jgi:ABC-type uncharacterized transport system permease subunit
MDEPGRGPAKEDRMKAFIASCVAAIAVAVVAAVVMQQLGMSSADVYSTSNVRL